MSAYIQQSDIQGRISQAGLLAALDDDGNGSNIQSNLAIIIGAASAKVDGKLASIYPVPFNPVPPIIYDCALNIACYMVYKRVFAGKEGNPFQDEYDDSIQTLDLVAKGIIGLDATVVRAFPPVIIADEPISTWGTTA